MVPRTSRAVASLPSDHAEIWGKFPDGSRRALSKGDPLSYNSTERVLDRAIRKEMLKSWDVNEFRIGAEQLARILGPRWEHRMAAIQGLGLRRVGALVEAGGLRMSVNYFRGELLLRVY
jgi:hypothetical protein